MQPWAFLGRSQYRVQARSRLRWAARVPIFAAIFGMKSTLARNGRQARGVTSVTSLASTMRGLLILGHTIASRAAVLVSTLIIVAPAVVVQAQDGPIAPIAPVTLA